MPHHPTPWSQGRIEGLVGLEISVQYRDRRGLAELGPEWTKPGCPKSGFKRGMQEGWMAVGESGFSRLGYNSGLRSRAGISKWMKADLLGLRSKWMKEGLPGLGSRRCCQCWVPADVVL